MYIIFNLLFEIVIIPWAIGFIAVILNALILICFSVIMSYFTKSDFKDIGDKYFNKTLILSLYISTILSSQTIKDSFIGLLGFLLLMIGFGIYYLIKVLLCKRKGYKFHISSELRKRVIVVSLLMLVSCSQVYTGIRAYTYYSNTIYDHPETEVYAYEQSNRYHLPNCSFSDYERDTQIHILTAEEANQRKYIPCPICKPERALTSMPEENSYEEENDYVGYDMFGYY